MMMFYETSIYQYTTIEADHFKFPSILHYTNRYKLSVRIYLFYDI